MGFGLAPATSLMIGPPVPDGHFALAPFPQFEGVRYGILGTYRKSRHYTERSG